MRYSIRSWPLLGLLLLLSWQVSAQDVVSSIRPLHLITLAISDGVTEPAELIPANASPHTFALRPSDMQRLTDARLIFWVGPELEQFLIRPLQRTSARVVQLHESEDAVPRLHQHLHRHHDHDHHDHDAHIWLDPENALQIAEVIHAELVQLYPHQQGRLDTNLAQFRQQVAALDAELEQQLAPLRERGFFVFHDAYGHFVEHYRLRQLGYFTLDPSRQPGARHLAQIRQRLQQSDAVCVFSEPQFTAAVVQSVSRGTGARMGELDPLGRDVEVSAQGYIDFLRQLGDAFSDCLTPE